MVGLRLKLYGFRLYDPVGFEYQSWSFGALASLSIHPTCFNILMADSQTDLHDLILICSPLDLCIPVLQRLRSCWPMGDIAVRDARELEVDRDKATRAQVVQNSGEIADEVLPSNIHDTRTVRICPGNA